MDRSAKGQRKKYNKRHGEKITGGGGGGGVAAAHVAPLESRNTSRDPAAPSATACNSRAPKL